MCSMLCKHLQEMAECVVLFHDAERPRVGQLLVLLKGDAAKKKHAKDMVCRGEYKACWK